MLSAEFLEAAKTMVILTTFWAIIVLDIWAIGSMITHFIMWVYKGIKKLSKKKNREQDLRKRALAVMADAHFQMGGIYAYNQY